MSDDEESELGDGDDDGYENVSSSITPEMEQDDVNELEPHEDMKYFESCSEYGSEELIDQLDDGESDESSVDSDRDSMQELVASTYMQAEGGELRVAEGRLNTDTLRAMSWTPATSSFEDVTDNYSGLSSTHGAPTAATRRLSQSPLEIFSRVFPKALWIEIAVDTNRYRRQNLEVRARAAKTRQKARHVLGQSVAVERLRGIKTRLQKELPIEPHEIVVAVGFLLADVLCLQTRGIFHQWSLSSSGALPVGMFGRYMARNRFSEIPRNLPLWTTSRDVWRRKRPER